MPTLHGKRKEISRSKTRKRIAMRKNRTENGSPGLFMGSNPHSYTETFSRSGDFSPRKYEATEITLDKITPNINRINRLKNSKFMNRFFDVACIEIASWSLFLVHE